MSESDNVGGEERSEDALCVGESDFPPLEAEDVDAEDEDAIVGLSVAN